MTPEGKLKADIQSALKKLGVWFTRIQCGKVRVKGGWMQLSEPGVADLLIIHKGKTIWAEIKQPKADQREAQKVFQERAKEAGHQYLVVRSVEDVLKAL